MIRVGDYIPMFNKGNSRVNTKVSNESFQDIFSKQVLKEGGLSVRELSNELRKKYSLEEIEGILTKVNLAYSSSVDGGEFLIEKLNNGNYLFKWK